MFEVGERIVCIDDTIKMEMLFPVIDMYVNWVKKGRVYTVRAILHNDDIVVGILLEEISNPSVFIKLINREQEPAFATWRFAKRSLAEIEDLNEAELEHIENEILADGHY
jgi:hypothetical protein